MFNVLTVLLIILMYIFHLQRTNINKLLHRRAILIKCKCLTAGECSLIISTNISH